MRKRDGTGKVGSCLPTPRNHQGCVGRAWLTTEAPSMGSTVTAAGGWAETAAARGQTSPVPVGKDNMQKVKMFFTLRMFVLKESCY